MMRSKNIHLRKFISFYFLFLFLQSNFSLWAKSEQSLDQALSTNTFQDVENKIAEILKTNKPSDVLLVLDIDNTILKMPQPLGSDQWFVHHADLMKNPSCKPQCLTNDFNELLKIQGKLYYLSSMVPPEPEIPFILKKIQDQKITFLILTSRGSDFYSMTHRELERNQYNFQNNSIGTSIGGTFIPFTKENFKSFNLTDEDWSLLKLNEARPVMYQNGVFMTSGMHKGVMLKYILNKFNQKFKYIVFVDDHEKHTNNMQLTMKDLTNIITFRYGKVDDEVQSYKKMKLNEQLELNKEWEKLDQLSKKMLKMPY
jgi:hypothetical protein